MIKLKQKYITFFFLGTISIMLLLSFLTLQMHFIPKYGFNDKEITINVAQTNIKSLDISINSTEVNASFLGEYSNDWSGYSVAGAGDVNGDGFDDFLIGSTYNDDGGNKAGKVYLFFGKGSGWKMAINCSQANASFIGEFSEDQAGRTLSGVGDVNGDDLDDFLIGSKLNDDGGDKAGKAYLFFGKNSGWETDMNCSEANASFIGEFSGDYCGSSVASAGDVNNDAYDDFLIGSERNSEGGSSAGQTYLFFGKNSGWETDMNCSEANASFIGEYSGDYSARSLTGAGDVNGDDYDDFLIGADDNEEGGSQAGQTYLFLGGESVWSMDTNLSEADASFIGDSSENSGSSLSSAGDLNNDGYDDFLIGADNNEEGGSNAGKVYLFFGKESDWSMDTNISEAEASFIGQESYENLGVSVAGVDDINSDGYDDILIGGSGDEEEFVFGKAYLFFGRTLGWNKNHNCSNADVTFIGESYADDFALALAGVGDVDGNGNNDLLLGAKSNGEGGESAGQSYLFLGSNYEVNPSGSDVPKLIPGYSLSITFGILIFSIILIAGFNIKRR